MAFDFPTRGTTMTKLSSKRLAPLTLTVIFTLALTCVSHSQNSPADVARNPLAKAAGSTKGILCTSPNLVGFKLVPQGKLPNGQFHVILTVHREPSDSTANGGRGKWDTFTAEESSCYTTVTSSAIVIPCMTQARLKWSLSSVIIVAQDAKSAELMPARINVRPNEESLDLFGSTNGGGPLKCEVIK
jgi:hypothetical protein